jgi:hypothetical protein
MDNAEIRLKIVGVQSVDAGDIDLNQILLDEPIGCLGIRRGKVLGLPEVDRDFVQLEKLIDFLGFLLGNVFELADFLLLE